MSFNSGSFNICFYSIKDLYFSNSLPLSPTKSYYWNVFLRTINKFSEQNCLNKPVFNNLSSLNHSSPMNSNVTSKIKHFTQLFALGLQLALKWKWHYLISWSTITTTLVMYVYKCKDYYLCKGFVLWFKECTKHSQFHSYLLVYSLRME